VVPDRWRQDRGLSRCSQFRDGHSAPPRSCGRTRWRAWTCSDYALYATPPDLAAVSTGRLRCFVQWRRSDGKQRSTWGPEPFTLGLWVGNRVTPGTTEQAHQAIEAIRDKDRNRSGIASPAQLTSCPWCGTEIFGRDIEVDKTACRTSIYCGDKLSQCLFSKARSSERRHPGIPVQVVDEEIYHRPPSMMIATVDKFAMMAWRPEVRTLFG
jgi:hypothetical protein